MEEIRMRVSSRFRNTRSMANRSIAAAATAFTILLVLTPAAHADPLVFQTGMVTGNFWPVLIIGLALEAFILALVIKRPLGEALAVSLMANAVSGFAGFIFFLLLRLYGIGIIPPGPAMVLAILIEAPIISLMLAKPPVKRVITGVATANLATGIIAFIMLSFITFNPDGPSAEDDLSLARGLASLRGAINEYHDLYGFYPESISGGSRLHCDENTIIADPLLRSGILESYPENPYSDHLRSVRYTAKFLLTGLGRVTTPVDLDSPTNEWEARWFPAMQSDQRFGDPDNVLLCANGLSDSRFINSLKSTFYNMNSLDIIPGCFFYKSYDFNSDGLADDFILGAFGWPSGSSSIGIDIIDAATGDICLSMDSNGYLHCGVADGLPEPVAMLYVACTPVPE